MTWNCSQIFLTKQLLCAVVILLVFNTKIIVAHGMTTIQCSNGYYLSKFSSAFDGNERYYKFGCSRFSAELMTFDEDCTMTETASTENGDMFLSCNSDQYSTGIEIIENISNGNDSWQLLCCKSESIKLRTGDCIDTKFINDQRRSSSFSSSAQVIRRWQAMPENGDLRWWLQICPVDITIKKPRSVSEIRAKRQLPWEWSRGRFPVAVENYNPIFLEHLRREEEQNRQLFENSGNSVGFFDQNNVNELHTATNKYKYFNKQNPTTTNVPATSPTPLSSYRSKTYRYNKRIRSRIITPAIPTIHPMHKPKEKPIEALDYYDMYDENFDKKKHTEGGLLRGVSEFLQNIQDGLTLAQVAFPANQKDDFHFRIDVTQPTTKRSMPNIMFSDDEDNLQIGPFVQQSDGKNSQRLIQTTTPSTAPKREVNTIEGMLQMFGLCQGHGEL